MTYPTKKQVTPKPPAVNPVEEFHRRAFNELTADQKRYVLAAKQDGIPYHGESFLDFIRVVDETERLRESPGWLEELKAHGLGPFVKDVLRKGKG